MAACLLFGCDSTPDDVREWAPGDHDQPSNPAAQGQVTARPGADDTNLVELAWMRNCASCHGSRGRGDGPQGPMMKAPDLTRPDLDKVSDAELANVIKKGRNKMPSFESTLPAPIVDSLVKRIRGNRAK